MKNEHIITLIYQQLRYIINNFIFKIKNWQIIKIILTLQFG